MVDPIPLNKLREITLKQVKRFHDTEGYENEQVFEVVDANIDAENNVVNLRIHVLITQNTLSYQNYAVNILIERYRIKINSTDGNVTISIPILNIAEPDVFTDYVGIEFATKELWDNSSLEEIQQHVTNEWNKTV